MRLRHEKKGRSIHNQWVLINHIGKARPNQKFIRGILNHKVG